MATFMPLPSRLSFNYLRYLVGQMVPASNSLQFPLLYTLYVTLIPPTQCHSHSSNTMSLSFLPHNVTLIPPTQCHSHSSNTMSLSFLPHNVTLIPHSFFTLQGPKIGLAFAISLGFSIIVVLGLVSECSSLIISSWTNRQPPSPQCSLKP